MRTKAYDLTNAERANLLQCITHAMSWMKISEAEREQLEELAAKFEFAFSEEEPTPPWRTEIFTGEEQDTMVICVMDEIRDSIKDLAQEQLDTYDLVECIGLVDEDLEQTVILLNSLRNGQPLHNGNWEPVRQFCKRFGLIDESELPVTPLGHQYLERWDG